MEEANTHNGHGIAHIINLDTPVYRNPPLTKEELIKMWDQLLNSKIESVRKVVIYTGFLGHICWKLRLLELSFNTTIPLWVTDTHKVNNLYYYFSLYKKSGSVKIKVVYNGHEWVYECYRNTTFLFTFKDFTESIIKALKSISMEDEQDKQYTNAQLREMRQWVRENFIPGVNDVDHNWHKVMKDEARRMEEEDLREIDDIYLNQDE